MTALRFDPFRELDRWASEVMGSARAPRLMPLDAYRHGESYVLRFDLPGIDPDSMEVVAENYTLTVRAVRRNDAPEGAQFVVSERPVGTYSRQIVLGDGLDVENVDADYRDGVLTLTIPVAEQAKPRRIEIGRSKSAGGQDSPRVISGESSQHSDQGQLATSGARS